MAVFQVGIRLCLREQLNQLQAALEGSQMERTHTFWVLSTAMKTRENIDFSSIFHRFVSEKALH